MNWEALLGLLMHPTQLAVVEAMLWVDSPLSPVQLVRLFGNGSQLPSVAYHVGRLSRLGVLEETGTRQVRGAVEHFFCLNAALAPAL